jgi:hypothetical protein
MIQHEYPLIICNKLFSFSFFSDGGKEIQSIIQTNTKKKAKQIPNYLEHNGGTTMNKFKEHQIKLKVTNLNQDKKKIKQKSHHIIVYHKCLGS